MILIISKIKRFSSALSEMFRYMGIPSYAATPSEALSLVCPVFKAVLILNPDLLADKEDYALRLRSYASVPIFSVSDTADECDKIIFDGIIKNTAYASKIYSALVEFADKTGAQAPGVYKLAGINASVDLSNPTYFDKVIPLTKTETMILRTLIATYPTPLCAKEILKYAFRQNKLPEDSNIRTHISVMNRKFREITGRNLTVLTQKQGYRILTPEIIEALI